MIEKRTLCGEQVSLLGMGNMRLPMLENGDIDRVRAGEMVDYLYQKGVNYFDTAYVYHKGESEEFIGEALAKYPRDSWYLATKTPGHMVNPNYDPVEALDIQFKRCKVDYFDFYLLHNVMENSVGTYTDPNLRVLDYLLEQKAQGKLRHVGISSHFQLEPMERYLREFGKDIEFVQIQLNYLDWTLQQAKEKYEMITELGLPVIVMEPCRGGLLAKANPGIEAKMNVLAPGKSAASWAYRFAGSLPNVKVVLTGASDLEQAKDNADTFTDFQPLSDAEQQLLAETAAGMVDLVPCTACKYCMEGCPMGLDIPTFLNIYNDAKVTSTVMQGMAVMNLPEDKKPSACIGCGACTQVCPQGIDIPTHLAALTAKLQEGPDWTKVSAQRLVEDRKVK